MKPELVWARVKVDFTPMPFFSFFGLPFKKGTFSRGASRTARKNGTPDPEPKPKKLEARDRIAPRTPDTAGKTAKPQSCDGPKWGAGRHGSKCGRAAPKKENVWLLGVGFFRFVWSSCGGSSRHCWKPATPRPKFVYECARSDPVWKPVCLNLGFGSEASGGF